MLNLNLSELKIDTVPMCKDVTVKHFGRGEVEYKIYDTSHIQIGSRVALTEEGLEDYNGWNTARRVGLGALAGLVALPAIIGGGIGLAMGGEAVGLGLAELGIIGGFTGASLGKLTMKSKTGHVVDHKYNTVSFIDMVGIVVDISRLPGSQLNYVKVKWYAKDEMGRNVIHTLNHMPEFLYGLTDA